MICSQCHKEETSLTSGLCYRCSQGYRYIETYFNNYYISYTPSRMVPELAFDYLIYNREKGQIMWFSYLTKLN